MLAIKLLMHMLGAELVQVWSNAENLQDWERKDWWAIWATANGPHWEHFL